MPKNTASHEIIRELTLAEMERHYMSCIDEMHVAIANEGGTFDPDAFKYALAWWWTGQDQSETVVIVVEKDRDFHDGYVFDA